MGKLLIWLVVVELAFVGFGLLAGSALQMDRRAHFWARVLVGCLAMPSLALLVAEALILRLLPANVLMLVWLLLAVAALVVAPIACYRGTGSSPGTPGSDGGGGSGPHPPPPRPSSPTGGIPLPDADQAAGRVRDHNRPKLRDARPRRRSREPERAPKQLNG